MTDTPIDAAVTDGPEYPILEGILDPLECADEIEELYLHGPTPGVSTGFHALDAYYRPKLGQWTIVTGIPGSGKSTFVDSILVNVSELHGWKHLICSPEHQPVARHIAALAGIHARQTFHKDFLSEEAYFQSLKFVQDHFRFINPPEEHFTPAYIFQLAKAVEAQGFNFDGFVIDPWNELEHKRPAQFSETEYISYALSKFRRFCRDQNKHLWLVAHPVKMRKLDKKVESVEQSAMTQFPIVTLYDISGSAHFFNKCDNGLSLWRDKYASDNLAQVHVQKIRFRECGKLGMADLRFDWQSGRYENL